MTLISQPVVLGELVGLPEPFLSSEVSLEESLAHRRSVRLFVEKELTVQQLGQLLWASQGITRQRKGWRTAPSAGALFPLEMYVAIKEGVYHYSPADHRLKRVASGDRRGDLQRAAFGQTSIGMAPAIFIITAIYERTSRKYGERAVRYVHIETGHACQNLLLQAVALGLSGVPIGAFYDDRVQEIVGGSADIHPLYLVPVGYPRQEPVK